MLIFLSFIELNDLIFVCYFLDCRLKIYRSCYLNVSILCLLRMKIVSDINETRHGRSFTKSIFKGEMDGRAWENE